MQRLKDFEAWLRNEKIVVHPALHIHGSRDGTYSVAATYAIARDTLVLTVPKSALLTPRTCGIANLLGPALDDEDMDAMTACCLAYLYERHDHTRSPWSAYLTLCPSAVPIAKLWDKGTARAVLKGTEVAMVGGTTVRDFKTQYDTSVLPWLTRHTRALGAFSRTTLREFMDGMSVVGSRAFEIDAYHGLGMCPYADLLNHSIQEHVHFQTTFDVCSQCGEHGSCEHDASSSDTGDHDDECGDSDCMDGECCEAGNSPNHNPKDSRSNEDGEDGISSIDDDDVCEFIVVRDIHAGEQVFNTYGELGNDVLLARYGFSLLANPHDRLSLGPETLALFPAWHGWWALNGTPLMASLDAAKRNSDESGEEEEVEEEEEEVLDLEDTCFIDANGNISRELVYYLILSTIDVASLASKSGAQVKAHVQVIESGWRYVQPGRMPLPRFLFLDAISTVVDMLEKLERILQAREKRYSVASSDIPIVQGDAKLDYARIVRRNEESIARKCRAHASGMRHACEWLLERAND